MLCFESKKKKIKVEFVKFNIFNVLLIEMTGHDRFL